MLGHLFCSHWHHYSFHPRYLIPMLILPGPHNGASRGSSNGRNGLKEWPGGLANGKPPIFTDKHMTNHELIDCECSPGLFHLDLIKDVKETVP